MLLVDYFDGKKLRGNDAQPMPGGIELLELEMLEAVLEMLEEELMEIGPPLLNQLAVIVEQIGGVV
jgi:hypothetical protein